jgi:hypothetical protein
MEHCTPSELLKIESVKKRFKTPQQIGYFIKNYRDKLNYFYDARTVHIPKEEFLRFIDHIEKFSPIKSIKSITS